jgi:hypothetical protein
MDALRRDYRYDQLPGWDDTDTTYVVDGDSYVVHHTITAGAPETNATTVALGVEWIAKVSGSDVARTLQTTTILARGLP